MSHEIAASASSSDLSLESKTDCISFAGHISDAELAIESAGFVTSLWIPEFGWQRDEEEASARPHPPQLLAALQCFIAFFVKLGARSWAHLGAEMQAGKTGVINALIRIILANVRTLKYTPNRIFVVTGMSDNAWKLQTRERLPSALRENVYHNGGLIQFAKKITSLSAGNELSNVLIVIDESHIASKCDHRPQTQIYDTVARLCPQSKWKENNIRFLTISATDPAKVITISGMNDAEVVRLQTTDAYQSIERLHESGRIRSLEKYKNINSVSAIAELKRCVSEEFNDRPYYHILRAPQGKIKDVVDKLAHAFPDGVVREFHAEHSSSSKDDSSSVSSLDNINVLLNDAPEQHTFIVLKNMLYAAKTLLDDHVGVLWDRLSSQDATTFQSLAGRACGYNKSNRTVVYTSDQAVKNYIQFWRELCTDPRMSPIIPNVSHKDVAGRMGGVEAVAFGNGVRLVPCRDTSQPLTSSSSSVPLPPRRKLADESDFAHSYQEFPTFEAARAAAKGIHTPDQDEEKFYLTSTTGKATKQSYTAVIAICNGKKTANLPHSTLTTIGQSRSRLYVGYKDLSDPSTGVFVVRTLTKIK